MKNPVLGAFEIEGSIGRYNVWRYDTPTTQCILASVKAESREDAIKQGLEKIQKAKAEQ
jgi:hypothetical protein